MSWEKKGFGGHFIPPPIPTVGLGGHLRFGNWGIGTWHLALGIATGLSSLYSMLGMNYNDWTGWVWIWHWFAMEEVYLVKRENEI